MKHVKKLINDMDKGILIISIILFVFGLLNIVNASSQAVVIRYGTSLYEYFNKQAVAILLGLVITLIILVIPTKNYPKISFVSYFIILGLLIYLYIFGTEHQGSKNWIKVGPLSLQPSEFAKPTLILIVSVFFEKFYRVLKNPKTEPMVVTNLIGMVLMSAGLYVGIIFLQKDLGTTIIIAGIFGILFLLSPLRRKQKFQTSVVVIVAVLLFAVVRLSTSGSILTPTQASRLDYKNPCSNYEEGGYQICNGFIAINDGGLFGVGIGNSKQVSYLPESHTDSVFAIIAEEYGLLFCSSLFLLYILLLYRIFLLSEKVNTIKGKYICIGVASYIAIHIIVNLGGLFASMPLTGVPLPFLSYGGSFTLSLMIALAMVQRISIEHKRKKIVIK